jgi:hypothetical protein
MPEELQVDAQFAGKPLAGSELLESELMGHELMTNKTARNKIARNKATGSKMNQTIRCALLAGTMLTVLALARTADAQTAADPQSPVILAQAPPAVDPQTGRPLPKGVLPKGPPGSQTPPAAPKQVQQPPTPPAAPKQVLQPPTPPVAPK